MCPHRALAVNVSRIPIRLFESTGLEMYTKTYTNHTDDRVARSPSEYDERETRSSVVGELLIGKSSANG